MAATTLISSTSSGRRVTSCPTQRVTTGSLGLGAIERRAVTRNRSRAAIEAGHKPNAANQQAKEPVPPISPNSLKPRKLVTPSDK